MKNGKKVLFVYCYAPATQGKLKNVGGSHPPIGILYPAAVLEKQGHEVKISDRYKRIVREFYLRPTYLINFLKRFSWLELSYMTKMFGSFTKM